MWDKRRSGKTLLPCRGWRRLSTRLMITIIMMMIIVMMMMIRRVKTSWYRRRRSPNNDGWVTVVQRTGCASARRRIPFVLSWLNKNLPPPLLQQRTHTHQYTCTDTHRYTRTHAAGYWNISAGISLDDDTHKACWYSIDEPSRHGNPVLPWQQRKCCARAGGMGRRGARWQFVKVNLVLPFPFQSIHTAPDLGLVPRVMMKDEIKNFFLCVCVWKLEDKGWHDRPVFPETGGGPNRLKQRTPGFWLQELNCWFGAW